MNVGVLGGGQLGRMMAQAAHRMGVRLVVLDPAGARSPAAQAGALAVEGSFRDAAKIRELAARVEGFQKERQVMLSYIEDLGGS